MNKVAWNITFENKVFLFDKNLFFVETENENWTYNYFFYWKSYRNFDTQIVADLEKIAWIPSITSEISVSNEDHLEVYFDKQISWNYVSISVEWKDENFQTVLEKFKDSSPYIVAIRESDVSWIFGNRIIKIDIVD